MTRHWRSLPEPAPCHAAMPRLPCRSLALPLRSETSALKCRPGSCERRCHEGRPTSSSAVWLAVLPDTRALFRHCPGRVAARQAHRERAAGHCRRGGRCLDRRRPGDPSNPRGLPGTIPATMLIYPSIDPVALQIGPLAIHWYGLSYLAVFGLFMLVGCRRWMRPPFVGRTGPGAWSRKGVEDFLFLGVAGVVLGGRLGYCLFYKPGYYPGHPREIFALWQGGMAFHGGLLGVIVAMLWFAHSRQRPLLQVADFVAPCVPTGLAAGRVGNFINGELWGRFASPDLPWGMVFAHSGSMHPRHPSQVYQFLLEGLLLFVLLWLYARRERRQGQVAAAFLVGYGVLRFIAEQFREPDAFLGILALGMSMGQWLGLPMIAGGVLLWCRAARRAAGSGAGFPRLIRPASARPGLIAACPSSMRLGARVRGRGTSRRSATCFTDKPGGAGTSLQSRSPGCGGPGALVRCRWERAAQALNTRQCSRPSRRVRVPCIWSACRRRFRAWS